MAGLSTDKGSSNVGMKRSVVALHFALSLALLLSACGGGGGSGGSSGGNSGGGGGGGNTPPPTTVSNSNWDELVWDQDNWS